MDPLVPRVVERIKVAGPDKRQCALLTFAAHWLRVHGKPPTDNEVQAAFAWAATGLPLTKCR